MENLSKDEKFDSAVSIVNAELKKYLLSLDAETKEQTYEIRLRSGQPLVLCGKYGTAFINENGVTKSTENCIAASHEAVTDTFNRLCCFSIHTHLPSIVNGYITMQGGHRVGIAGTAVTDSDGRIISVKDVYSVNIRVSRQTIGAADELIDRLFLDKFSSTIIAGPVSCGKTTILRDLARQLSSPDNKKMYKLCVIDERQEIACVNGGIAGNDLGVNCDILSCYPKGQAIITAIKTMSPDIIVLDEVATVKEIEAIKLGVNSGVKFIVTVHAENYEEILHRQQIEMLINTYSFQHLVLLSSNKNVGKIKEIFNVGELRDEIIRRRVNLDKSDFTREFNLGSA